jgi:hypothetical protein
LTARSNNAPVINSTAVTNGTPVTAYSGIAIPCSDCVKSQAIALYQTLGVTIALQNKIAFRCCTQRTGMRSLSEENCDRIYLVLRSQTNYWYCDRAN